MSAHQVKTLKEENVQGMSPLLDAMPSLCPFSHLAAEDNKLQREIVLTNQEGKLYYATCLEYFIDLKCIEREFVQHSPRCFQTYIMDQMKELNHPEDL